MSDIDINELILEMSDGDNHAFAALTALKVVHQHEPIKRINDMRLTPNAIAFAYNKVCEQSMHRFVAYIEDGSLLQRLLDSVDQIAPSRDGSIVAKPFPE